MEILLEIQVSLLSLLVPSVHVLSSFSKVLIQEMYFVNLREYHVRSERHDYPGKTRSSIKSSGPKKVEQRESRVLYNGKSNVCSDSSVYFSFSRFKASGVGQKLNFCRIFNLCHKDKMSRLTSMCQC